MEGYLVKTSEPPKFDYPGHLCNWISQFTDYNDAKLYFDEEVTRVISKYMKVGDTLEKWLDKNNGIVVNKYKGSISDNRIEFDSNVIELIKVEHIMVSHLKHTPDLPTPQYIKLDKKKKKARIKIYDSIFIFNVFVSFCR